MNNDIIFRLEKEDEYFLVENLVRESFWNVYRPGAWEHYVLHQLRKDKDFIKDLDYAMLKDEQIIGQNVFLKTNLKSDDGRLIPIATMGPICIDNAYKRKGYGKILLDYTLKKAKEYGIGALCFEGNIDFYGKSGFDFASKYGIRYHGLPYGEDASFFLCKELIPHYLDGVKGEYETPKVYMVSENDVDEYDKKFPYKEKLKLDTQIF